MMISKTFKIFSVVTLLFSLTSCIETVVLGSAATGAIVMREKSLTDTTHDATISTKMGAHFIAEGLKNVGNSVDITVNEGRVLLTGAVRKEDNVKLASKLAWKTPKVKEVINEIHIRDDKAMRPRNFSNSIVDYFLTTRVEIKLFALKDVSSINYKITTVDKVVYLLGVAKDDAEIRKVLNSISKIRGVNKVVNHIILVGDARRRG